MYVLIPVYIRMCLMYVCISFIYVYMYVFMYVCMYVCMYVRNERLLISFRWSLNHPSKAVSPPPTRSGLSVTDKLYVCVCMYVCMYVSMLSSVSGIHAQSLLRKSGRRSSGPIENSGRVHLPPREGRPLRIPYLCSGQG